MSETRYDRSEEMIVIKFNDYCSIEIEKDCSITMNYPYYSDYGISGEYKSKDLSKEEQIALRDFLNNLIESNAMGGK